VSRSLRAWLVALAAACSAAAAAASPPPAVHAKAWIVEDGTGEVLGASNAGAQRPIASITKLMTVLVVLDRHALSDVVTVDERAAEVGQESIALHAGEQLTVGDLVRGALIQSANDAAVALALATAPDLPAFAKLMNAKAAALGLTHTNFVRPDGLDAPGEYSSAADVTKLARAAMRVPFIRDTVREQTATIAGGRVLHTWNDLLGTWPGVVGVKTGHTSEAGWSQVVADRQGETTIYATILGSPAREQRNADLERLISWGFGQFMLVQAVASGHSYARVALPYGRAPLSLHASSGLRLLTLRGRPLVQRVVAPRAVDLPIRRGQVLGRVEIWSGRRLLGYRPLVAARRVAQPGLLGRAGWYAGRTVDDIAGWFG
jgi:D-alanyl-D-alanine carboxypeptidase (penicillin-binding protein 5/6)